jgi:hypothetical protein
VFQKLASDAIETGAPKLIGTIVADNLKDMGKINPLFDNAGKALAATLMNAGGPGFQIVAKIGGFVVSHLAGKVFDATVNAIQEKLATIPTTTDLATA